MKKKKIYKYENYILSNRNGWYKVVKIKVPTLSAYCVTYSALKEFIIKYDLGLPKDKALLFVDYQIYLDGNVFRPKDSLKSISLWIRNNPLKIGELLINAENKLIDNLIKESKKLNRINISKKSEKEIKKIIDNYLLIYQKAFPLINVSIILEKVVSEILHNKIERIFDKQKTERIFQILTTQLEKSTIGKKEEKILKIASKVNQLTKKELDNILDKLTNEFSFLGMRYFGGRPLTKNYFKQEIKIASKNIIILKKRKEKKEKELKKKFNKIYRNIKSKNNKELIDFTQKVILHKTERLDNINRASFLFRSFYNNKLANILGLKYDDFIYLTVPEIKEFLKNNKIILSKIKKRKKCYAIIPPLLNKKIQVIENPEEVNHYIDLMEKYVRKVDKIKGNVVMGGLVKGKIKIIKEEKDFKKLKKKDILVTEMTTPDFVPIMKKASAIITDLGGITSHAAIISRELGIPCIVGTKIATKVLKDGDYVEVDANKGIVRKIEKKK